MKKFYVIIIVAFLVLSFFGTLVFLYRKAVERDVLFETETPFYTDIVKKAVATGTITPRREIEIKSQVSGVVEKLYVEPGEIVKDGDLLAKIRIIPDMVNLNNAESQLNTARINFENAKQEKERQAQLYEKKFISEFDYDQYVLEFNLAEEQLESAANNVQLIREGTSNKEGQVTNEVTSTVNGMVLDVPVREGTFIIETNTFNEGTTIMFIADMKSMIFEGHVDESEIGKIKDGMELILTIGAIDTEKFKALLEYISPKGEEIEGAIQFEIRAAVELSEEHFIRAGYSANADIVLDTRENVLAVRESNLTFEKDNIFVEIEKEYQEFEKKQIETGLSDGINIEVMSGVTEKDKIKKL
jgi:HlyD family secretion protein